METRRSKEELKSLIEGYMKSSYERLSSAKLLLDAEKFRDSISRSYYAFLDAADALLLTKDLRPKSHSGTLRLFSQYLLRKVFWTGNTLDGSSV